MTHPSDRDVVGSRFGGIARFGAALAMLLALSAPALAQEAAEIEFW